MKEIKILTWENIPCWYELSFKKTKPTIVLRAHKDFIKNSKKISTDLPLIKNYKERFGFKKNVGDFDGDFGFDSAFKKGRETKDFVEFNAPIPLVKKHDGICDCCNGTGESDIFENGCIHCNGEGISYSLDMMAAYRASASFTMFFFLAGCFEGETSSSLLQLMTVETVTINDLSGCSLGGMFSIPLCGWLESLDEDKKYLVCDEITEAMRAAVTAMMGKSTSYYEGSTRTHISYGDAFAADCPGDACGIQPKHGYDDREEGRGYEFGSHNVDTPMQQLVLLVALAVLHDKAREGMK
ncbi:MAG: hypothetical protein GF387_01700 [Candidatus Portnoybacteria bacterium]|nr:hypothetical protein [Candidatus Portnoybacteria bacterium]